MESRNLPPWRRWVLGRLEMTLIVFEIVLSAIFFTISYLRGNLYLRGIGVGLLIAWVTSAVAYLYRQRALGAGPPASADHSAG